MCLSTSTVFVSPWKLFCRTSLRVLLSPSSSLHSNAREKGWGSNVSFQDYKSMSCVRIGIRLTLRPHLRVPRPCSWSPVRPAPFALAISPLLFDCPSFLSSYVSFARLCLACQVRCPQVFAARLVMPASLPLVFCSSKDANRMTAHVSVGFSQLWTADQTIHSNVSPSWEASAGLSVRI